ncbi:hypothetical protein ACFWIN_21515 [Streptomyces sp. NPDC127049]|uniref:hypothetical protein n=1 Tax=Streptomyces sp. NPDC127049 TaxID=3347118 RepID=UPI00365B5DC0
MIHKKSVRGTALAAAALAALAVSCGTTPEPDRSASGAGASPSATATTAAPESTAAPETTTAKPDTTSEPTADATDAPAGSSATPYPNDASAPSTGEKVRDAFATLQATLDDSCATNCEYFLTRVNKELQELDWAMKNDPKGPGHFPEPIRKIEELNKTLAGDSSFENLKKHEKKLVGTRDFINTWMQDHPDDYR